MEAAGTAAVTTGKGNAQGSREKMEEIIEMTDVLKKVPVREQDPKVRTANFQEVCLGYNKEEAMEEASRCLNCKNAKCIKGCPVAINIPGFI